MSEPVLPTLAPARERALGGIGLLAPITLFGAIYIAVLLAAGYFAVQIGYRSATYWIALASAAAATWFTVRVIEQGQWRIGFLVPPRLAVREAMLGIGFAAIVIGCCDVLLMIVGGIRHVPARGIAWTEILVIFVPAAIHEEIVFRGYLFQRIRAWSRPTAIGVTALVFAGLHLGNAGITAVAFVNLAFAGVLLALAYERFERLWFPIGIHFAWNFLTGPLLGFDVSGYASAGTLLRVVSSAPPWVSGGGFGIEGSAWILPVEMAAIAALAKRRLAGRE